MCKIRLSRRYDSGPLRAISYKARGGSEPVGVALYAAQRAREPGHGLMQLWVAQSGSERLARLWATQSRPK